MAVDPVEEPVKSDYSARRVDPIIGGNVFACSCKLSALHCRESILGGSPLCGWLLWLIMIFVYVISDLFSLRYVISDLFSLRSAVR